MHLYALRKSSCPPGSGVYSSEGHQTGVGQPGGGPRSKYNVKHPTLFFCAACVCGGVGISPVQSVSQEEEEEVKSVGSQCQCMQRSQKAQKHGHASDGR